MFKICFIHNLAKVDHFKFIPLGVMHHEPCRHAGSSTSVFLLGRIRKVSSLFLFSVLFIFFFIFLFLHMGSQGWFGHCYGFGV